MKVPPVALAARPENSPYPTHAAERFGVGLIMAAFVAVGLNHIHCNAVFGQDFMLHAAGTDNIIADPSQWFPQDFTNRPLVYWIGAGCHWLTHGNATYEVAGVVFVAMATAALGFFHGVTRRCLASP